MELGIHVEHLNRAIDDFCMRPIDALEEEVLAELDARAPIDVRYLIEPRNRRVLMFAQHWTRDELQDPQKIEFVRNRVIRRILQRKTLGQGIVLLPSRSRPLSRNPKCCYCRQANEATYPGSSK